MSAKGPLHGIRVVELAGLAPGAPSPPLKLHPPSLMARLIVKSTLCNPSSSRLWRFSSQSRSSPCIGILSRDTASYSRSTLSAEVVHCHRPQVSRWARIGTQATSKCRCSCGSISSRCTRRSGSKPQYITGVTSEFDHCSVDWLQKRWQIRRHGWSRHQLPGRIRCTQSAW